MRLPDISRQVHHVNACSGQVVNVEELTHGFATAPDHDVLGIRLHGFMEPSQQRRNYVTVVGMKVVVRTIKIRGHHAAIVAPILAIVAYAQLDPGDLGDGIRLIRGLERAGEQRVRSEEHTSELQSLMRISYAVFCLKKKIT